MAAIITDALKKQFIVDTIDNIKDASNYYYVGLGKNEEWTSDSDTPITPVNSLREAQAARYGIQSIKLVTDATMVVPRSNWTTGAVFSGWDDASVGHPTNNFYVVTASNQVYVCLQQGRNASGQSVPSTIEPAATTVAPFYTADGYLWKYIYTIGAISANKFLAANYMPVQFIDSAGPTAPASEQNQILIQNGAIGGQLLGFEVVTTGNGYEEASPAISIFGDGTGAAARAYVEGGAVVKVTIDSDGSSNPRLGSGYNTASVEIAAPTGAGGTTAVIRPIIGPRAGIGSDPRVDLKASALMLNVKTEGDEDGDFIVAAGNQIRQVSLLRNPDKWQDIDSDFTSASGSSLKYFQVTDGETAPSLRSVVEGSLSGAKAYVDNVVDDGVGGRKIYFHQTEATGFRKFQEAETLTEVNGAGSATLESEGTDADSDAYELGAVNPFTGDLLYIDNRAAIDRSAGQTEDIKIVIQL